MQLPLKDLRILNILTRRIREHERLVTRHTAEIAILKNKLQKLTKTMSRKLSKELAAKEKRLSTEEEDKS